LHFVGALFETEQSSAVLLWFGAACYQLATFSVAKLLRDAESTGHASGPFFVAAPRYPRTIMGAPLPAARQ
jgi:hypothetical protein